MFTELPKSFAVIFVNGLYRDHPVYTYDGKLFAKISNGYLRLNPHGTTSKMKTFWKDIKLSTGHASVDGCHLVWNQKEKMAAE